MRREDAPGGGPELGGRDRDTRPAGRDTQPAGPDGGGLELGGAEVMVVATKHDVAQRSAAFIVRILELALRGRAEAHVALTGGSTPAGAFRILASPGVRDGVDWSRVHLWWGDDRFVPRGDPLCNVAIADTSLFRTKDGGRGIPSPADHVHPFPTDRAIGAGRDADWCAREYATELRRLVPVTEDGWPRFDVVMVGIGRDGHLLSVFPGSRAFDSPEWAVGIPTPTHVAPHVPRVTLNPRVVSAADAVLAMVTGAEKTAIVETIFGVERDPRRFPGQLAVRPGATWVIDATAAARLTIGRGPGESGPDEEREDPMAKPCTHVDQIRDVTPSAEGCEDCLRIGGQWVHLRMCLTCGHVGCCDISPNKHATKHFREVGHPIIRSHEPDETWEWCYVDEIGWEPR